MKLSIVIPAQNEEQRIGAMLDAYLPYYADLYGDDVEFLIVVNGSTDGTEAVAEDYAERHECMSVIVDPKPIGKGGALMMGFERAKGDFVGFADADGSTPPAAFKDLVDNIGDAGCVIASRWCKGAKVSPKQPITRRIASRILNILARLMFGLRLTDTQCGAKLMTRRAIQAVLPSLGITRWAFDVDLLFQMKRHNQEAKEIPTTWCDVAGSKLKVVSVSLEMFVALVRLRLIYSPFKWIVAAYDRFLGSVIHPAGGVQEDYLIRHSLLLLIAAQAANVLNFLYQIAMNRMLEPVDYGDMAAVLNFFLMASMAFGALAWTVAHFSSHLVLEGARNRVGVLVMRVWRDVMIVGTAMMIGLAIGATELAEFFNLQSPMFVVLAGAGLVVTISAPIFIGALNGCQEFGWLSGIGVGWSLVRILSAVAAVAIGFAAIGAVAAHVVSLSMSIVIYLVVMRRMGTWGGESVRVRGVYAYFSRYMLALLFYAVLVHADVLLVKHYFSAEDGGLFAKVSMIAHMVAYFPQPIAIAMFPKVVSIGSMSSSARRTFLKALVLTATLAVAVATLCTVFPGILLKLLTGTDASALVPVVRWMAWALAPFAVVFLIVTFEMAQRRFAIAIPLLVCAAVYVAGVSRYHGSFLEVIAVLGVVGVVALIGTGAMCWVSCGRKSLESVASTE